MVSKELFYSIALSMVPGIGHIKAKKLIEHCGSAQILFEEFPFLIKEFGSKTISFSIDEVLGLANSEIEYIQANQIRAYCHSDQDYPKRLKECADGPVVLYTKGSMQLNQSPVISIVGSRNASIKGKEICRRIIQELVPHQPLIISGLAYGIDITAHEAALENGLETIGVIGSGLKIIYPQKHKGIAKRMMEKGGLVSDYPSDTVLLPSQFAERNRLVAGLADATIVIESTAKGGSMITAGLALDYNRDIYAVPGRIDDELSEGCNLLIKNNRAALIESASDVERNLGLDRISEKVEIIQGKLLLDLKADEQKLVDNMDRDHPVGIDELSQLSHLKIQDTSSLLLGLEFKGLVRSLPGKRYLLV